MSSPQDDDGNDGGSGGGGQRRQPPAARDSNGGGGGGPARPRVRVQVRMNPPGGVGGGGGGGAGGGGGGGGGGSNSSNGGASGRDDAIARRAFASAMSDPRVRAAVTEATRRQQQQQQQQQQRRQGGQGQGQPQPQPRRQESQGSGGAADAGGPPAQTQQPQPQPPQTQTQTQTQPGEVQQGPLGPLPVTATQGSVMIQRVVDGQVQTVVQFPPQPPPQPRQQGQGQEGRQDGVGTIQQGHGRNQVQGQVPLQGFPVPIPVPVPVVDGQPVPMPVPPLPGVPMPMPLMPVPGQVGAQPPPQQGQQGDQRPTPQPGEAQQGQGQTQAQTQGQAQGLQPTFQIRLPSGQTMSMPMPVPVPAPAQNGPDAGQQAQTNQQQQGQQRTIQFQVAGQAGQQQQQRQIQFQIPLNAAGQPSGAPVPVLVHRHHHHHPHHHHHHHLRAQLPPLEPQPLPFDHQGGGGASAGGTGGSSSSSSSSSSSGDSDSDSDSEGEGAEGGDLASGGDVVPSPRPRDRNRPRLSPDSDFECSICYDTMDEPTSLPCCESRFCRSCIHRIWRDTSAAAAAAATAAGNAEEAARITGGGGRHGKCPCCRAPFGGDDIRPDDELRGRMERAGTVTCPFPNCGVKTPIRQVKSHHATCPYMPVRCRYAPYGCSWTGPKRDVGPHEEVGCDLAKVKGVVEQLRRANETQRVMANQLAQLRQGLGATQGAMHHNRNVVVGMQQRDARRADRPADLVWLVYEVCCHPMQFVRDKEVWKAMWGTEERRATVVNVLTLLPISLWVLRITASVSRGLFRLEYAPEDMTRAADDALLCLIVLALHALLITCHLSDPAGPTAWAPHPLRLLRKYLRLADDFHRPLMGDAAAACSAALHLAVLEFDGGVRGAMVWGCAAPAAAAFPRLVGSFLAGVAGADAGGGEGTGRAAPVASLGMRCGMIAYAAGIGPALDAALALGAIREAAARFSSLLAGRAALGWAGRIVSDLGWGGGGDGGGGGGGGGPPWLLGSAAAIRASRLWYWSLRDDDDDLPAHLLCTALALAVLPFMNLALRRLGRAGEAIGRRMATDAVAAGQGGARTAGVALGLVSFSVWLMALGNILIA